MRALLLPSACLSTMGPVGSSFCWLSGVYCFALSLAGRIVHDDRVRGIVVVHLAGVVT